MKTKSLSLLSTVAVSLLFSNTLLADDDHDTKTVYSMKAKNAHLIRHVTGPVLESIRGVPAIPVDSFLWSGQNIIDIKGHAKLKIDPENNTGEINAQWHDEYGHWTYHQDMFVSPPHPTGVVIGPSVTETQVIENDPVTTDVYLHGDTGAGGPVIPTVLNVLTTWGPAKVTLNDEVFPNTFDDMPMWMGHTMISEGVRNDEGAVLTSSGEVFNMMKSSEGITYPNEKVFHLVFHSMPGSMTKNVPPPLSFFYHVSFSNVTIKIKHKK